LDTPKKTKKFDEPIPLLAHLGELRKRIIYSVSIITVCSILMYSTVDVVIADLAKPVGKLYFTGPVEAFMTRLKISLFLGLLVSLPFVLFQFWSFIQGGLLSKEKRFILAVTAISFALFVAGASFCYFLILPVGVKFLIAYGSETLVPLITISKYLSFVTTLVFAFGLIFELPVIVGFLAKVGIVHSDMLRQQRRFAVVIIFIAAAALTPGPDVFSQVMMAVPLLVLYEASIFVARIIERRN
jgi:sec-independent protein translocase protein TatC